MIRVEANNYHKEFFKLRRKGEAFYFKLFRCANVFNATLANGNIISNLLIFSTNPDCKKKVYSEYFSGKAFD